MLDTLCYITINNQRYGLRLPYEIIYTEPTNPKAHINHNFYWNSLSSIQIKRNWILLFLTTEWKPKK